MIYTITLNPALDRTIWLDELKIDDTNRIIKEEKYAGGKGIDVSRVLFNFGVPNIALGFVGGFAGLEIEGLLINEGVNFDFIKISEETRTNIIINTTKNNNQIIISAKGPSIPPFELTKLMEKINSLDNPSYVVISGSLPEGLKPAIYAKIIDIAKSKSATVVLDTDGDVLKFNINHKPDIIKPNRHELSRVVGREIKTIDDAVVAAKEINRMGVKIVLVSLGKDGIVYVSQNTVMHAIPPSLQVINTIGAGDSSVAGFIYAKYMGFSDEEALVYAVATGSATTLKPGTALATLEDALSLKDKVKVRYL
ncbi:1-phosphofructokinase [Hydrogenobaculum acidophilum]